MIHHQYRQSRHAKLTITGVKFLCRWRRDTVETRVDHRRNQPPLVELILSLAEVSLEHPDVGPKYAIYAREPMKSLEYHGQP
jgi:hypothetical protein